MSHSAWSENVASGTGRTPTL